MIVITKSEELVSNCDVCGAINYDNEFSLNKTVDSLTEICVGHNTLQKNTLCDDCLKKLYKMLTNYIKEEKE